MNAVLDRVAAALVVAFLYPGQADYPGGMNRISSDLPHPLQPNIVDQVDGQSIAWFADQPETAFGGASLGNDG